MGKEELVSNPNEEVRQILFEYLACVAKLEQLVAIGIRFLVCFQQALEFLRRPPIDETSELVQNIIKANETKRLTSYIQAGCVNAYDSTRNVSQLNTSLSGLQDHLSKANATIDELETLMDRAGSTLQAVSELTADLSELNLSECTEQQSSSESEEIPLYRDISLDAADYASIMAVIHSMVKQDYLMQEKIVSSLSLKSSSEELDSYCMMWSLRPFVNDDMINEVIRNPR